MLCFPMEKIDGRRLKQEVQQALRDQVVRHRKQGKMNKVIAGSWASALSMPALYGRSM